jgi:hypothetical protein
MVNIIASSPVYLVGNSLQLCYIVTNKGCPSSSIIAVDLTGSIPDLSTLHLSAEWR